MTYRDDHTAALARIVEVEQQNAALCAKLKARSWWSRFCAWWYRSWHTFSKSELEELRAVSFEDGVTISSSVKSSRLIPPPSGTGVTAPPLSKAGTAIEGSIYDNEYQDRMKSVSGVTATQAVQAMQELKRALEQPTPDRIER